MTALLPSYPALKDSGARWLGTIPESWTVVRSKRLFMPRTELARADDVQLSATQAYGVIPQADFERAVGRKVTRILQHLEKRRHVEVDDFVISMRSFEGGLERAWASGCIRSSYVVLRPATPLIVGYYAYVFKSQAYIRALQSTASFIRDGQDLNFSNFCEVDLPCPPPSEQGAIARFLDHADRRIRNYIRIKQKLIKLLEEQKQAIIHRAVTRGLDPHVSIKPTGLHWLGDIPRHWEVRRLRYLIDGNLTYGANAPAEHANRNWPRYLRITDFRIDGTLRDDTFRSLPPEVAQNYLVKPGDVLLARSGATVGKAFLVTTEAGDACHAGYLIRARPRRAFILPEFLFAFTQSAGFIRWKDSTFIIATIQNIGADKYADLAVPLPPLSEQKAIIRFLEGATNNILKAIGRAQREISLFREYGIRLIDDVVTGKVDVRNAAALLPDEVAEVGSVEEFEFEADSESSDERPEALAEETEA